MIKLKNGIEVEYNKDFDQFFKNLLDAVIQESQSSVERKYSDSENKDSLNEIFLKELMDNCIYITHQLFEISSANSELSKFMVTGFIFNSILLTISQLDKLDSSSEEDDDTGTVH